MRGRRFVTVLVILGCLLPFAAWCQQQSSAEQLAAFRERLRATAQQQAARAETVATVENIQIPGPLGDIGLRVYRSSSNAAQPALLFIHGAGWVAGSVDTHDNIARKLANALPAVVVSVDYRLAPEHPYPASLEESYAALQWLHQHADNIGIDRTRIAVIGDSAGGNLAAALTLMSRDRHGPAIRAQALINPTLNLDSFDADYPCQAGADVAEFRTWMGFFRDHYLPAGADRRAAYVSPLYATDLTNLPPAFTITGELDLLCGTAEEYAARLRDAGGRSEGLRISNANHYGMAWATADPQTDAAFDAVVSFLRAQFARP